MTLREHILDLLIQGNVVTEGQLIALVRTTPPWNEWSALNTAVRRTLAELRHDQLVQCTHEGNQTRYAYLRRAVDAAAIATIGELLLAELRRVLDEQNESEWPLGEGCHVLAFDDGSYGATRWDAELGRERVFARVQLTVALSPLDELMPDE